jgi:dihydroorotase
MSRNFDLLIKGAVVVNHDGIGERDIAILDGRIAMLGSVPVEKAGEVINARGLHVLPGVIDTQVHFREPGNEHKEDLETGSRAAVMGGVTTVFEMPNTNPATTSAGALEDKVARARHRMLCDFAFWVGGTRENVEDIPVLEGLTGCAGIKVFAGSSTGDLLVDDEASLARILHAVRRRAAFHSEDELRLKSRIDLRRPGEVASHPEWRDEQAALQCTEMLVRLAEAAQKPIHILHVSTAEEIVLLSGHKHLVSVELTPHHLTLAAPDAYERLGTLAQMNPPLRDERHRTALWWGLEQGIADILGSDHAPHTLAEKAKPYPQSPSGMPGVQTLVPVMLDHVNAGRLSLERFVDMTSAGPQRLFGIAGKGRIAVGYDADLTIVDMKRCETIRNEWIASRCGWTPYDGVSVTGWPVGTVVRGRRVMWQGEILGPARGEPVRFALV